MQIILCSVKVAEWPPLGEKLLTQLIIQSRCILSMCCLRYFRVWFRRQVFVLFVSVPDHCLLMIKYVHVCSFRLTFIQNSFHIA